MSEQKALDRANKVYTNYHEAKDNVFSNFGARFRSFVKSCGLPAGVSNCTLSATQWIDPNNPIMRAQTIYDNPETHGYTAIDAKDAIPGNLLITRNPETGGFHTMIIEGFDENDQPILRYSSGGHGQSALRTGIPLNVYHERDKAQGGNHTQDLYYRYNYPNSYWLPEITIMAAKQFNGGTINYLNMFNENN